MQFEQYNLDSCKNPKIGSRRL